jgi:hypothetical protein
VSAYVLSGDITDRSPGLRLYLGNPGSGKSYAMAKSVIAAARHRAVVVVDATREWADDDGRMMRRLPADVRAVGARRLDRVLEHAGKPGVIVYHPSVWVEDTVRLADALSRTRGVGLAVSEAHTVLPSGVPLSPGWDALVTRWRHLHASVWLDTQRPARLARTVTELATTIALFACNGPRDADAVAELVSDPAELHRANAIVCSKLAKGEPGWHVRLGLDRTPPYQVVRA